MALGDQEAGYDVAGDFYSSIDRLTKSLDHNRGRLTAPSRGNSRVCKLRAPPPRGRK